MTYWKSSGSTIGIGHRVPLAFFDRKSEGKLRPELGMDEGEEKLPPVGEIRALLFWKYRLHPRPLWTSTGYFDILIGTTVTQAEWDLAKQTSSAHVLLLLLKLGIGQVSDLHRQSVTADPRWTLVRDEIHTLSEERALRVLDAVLDAS